MGEFRAARRGIVRAAAIAATAGLLTACASEMPEPAPVEMKGAALGMPAPPIAAPRPGIAPAPAAARRVVVRPGQSVGKLAVQYHVAKSAIITANHLQPPDYKVKIGQSVIIPGGGDGMPRPALASAALPPTTIVPVASPGARPQPDVIPLDAAPPRTAAALAPPPPRPPVAAPATLAPPPVAAAKPAPEPSTHQEARAEPAGSTAVLPHGGHFSWPVRGRVLAGYGVAASGAHNDGINIAAAKGTPVAAVDSGIVAYAGNELRGYGNLILIKHADGWISAYAHCEEILVKKGDPIRRGQVIAKVGATGGVDEPQLHFELRRGQKPVDPREFMAPAPSAETAPAPAPASSPG